MSKEYSDYNILFSNKEDKRVNLFIHTVNELDEHKKGKNVFRGYVDKFTNTNSAFRLEEDGLVANHMRSLYYDDVGEVGTHIHKEWGPAILDFILYVNSVSTPTINSINSLSPAPSDKLVRDVYNSQTNNNIPANTTVTVTGSAIDPDYLTAAQRRDFIDKINKNYKIVMSLLKNLQESTDQKKKFNYEIG